MVNLRFLLPGLTGLLLLALTPALSQTIKKFSATPDGFIQDMQQFLSETNRKEAEKLMKEFVVFWNAGGLTDEQKRMVYENSNAMLQRRLKAFPDFSIYLLALMSFVESGQSAENFKSWHMSMNRMMQGSVRRFSDFLEICYGLFKNNTLYESANVRWAGNHPSFIFEFDSLPKITFPQFTLTCYARNDSLQISDTRGHYYPSLRLFYGTGGRVTWERAGLPAADVYALLKRYTIDLTGSEYQADSVTFFYRMIFPEPLTGWFTDKLLANTTVENATYPRFRSYTSLHLKDLIPAAEFKGGFSLHGSRMIGSRTAEANAQLIFRYQGKPLMVLSSKSFVVRPEKVSSDRASLVIYREQEGITDSIYHSDIEFKYLTREEEITILRNTQSNSNSPFYNSFHKVDMFCDALIWKVRDPQIHIRMVSGGGESKMTFESVNYFREQRFRRLQGLNSEHPLYRLRKYAEHSGSSVIYASDLARTWKISESQIRNLFIDLANEGFLAYDPDENRALLKEKTDFYLKANVGKIDYDILTFNSLISARPNATINLLNFDITLRGVAQVMLSDSQQVYVIPRDQEIVLKSNRNFTCSGRIRAGYLDFYGHDFQFDYDRFKIILPQIDSLRLRIAGTQTDEWGRPVKIAVRSLIEQLNGELLIDNDNNKSGYRPGPSFPVFKSLRESYVFYEYSHIFDSIYRKSDFYFKLDPFILDSLDNYSREGLAFTGIFNSAGIFAPMRETLVLQPDLSLGFSRMTPAEGLAAYHGRGIFYQHLHLSHQGLRGKGRIEYLTSISHSDTILFFPDSANYHATHFEIQKRTLAHVPYPDVIARDVYIHWRPKEHKMFVFRKSLPMDMYSQKAILDGHLVLSDKGVNATGRILFEQAELLSEHFYLKQSSFGADTADFILNTELGKVMALTTKNMRSHIDLDRRQGEFRSNGSGSYIHFPFNQYICFIEQFRWHFDRKDIQFLAMAGQANMNVEGAEFVSVHPAQDSLRFFAPEANYSLTDYQIRTRGVKQILVADAAIIPQEGIVIIQKDARMQTLENATVIANTVTRYHTMINATINITGRKNYSGQGEYSYTDMAGVKHLIRLPLIGVDTTGQTFARGEIADTMNFSLSPNIQYKGKVELHAASNLLYFSGLARLNHQCDAVEKFWFTFASYIDPAGVNIPVMAPVSETRDKLSVSISMSADSLHLYPAFLSPKRKTSDKDLLAAEGYLKYDSRSTTYIIGPLPDETTGLIPGNSLSLEDKKCLFTGEGKIDFGVDFGQLIMKAIGRVELDYYRDSIKFDLFMDLDFMFSEEALHSMVEQILFNPSLSSTTDNRPVFHKAIMEILGRNKGDKLLADLSLYGATRKIPEELQHSLVLSEVRMYWDKQRQSYRSYGPIGIGFVNKQTVGRMVNGYLEIQKRRTGDVFNFYFETDPSTWYYFNYARGVMQAISSEIKFNDIISNTREEKRVAREKNQKAPYQYMLSTERKKNEFIKRFTEEN